MDNQIYLKSGTGAVKKKTAKGSRANAYRDESRPEGTPMVAYLEIRKTNTVDAE